MTRGAARAAVAGCANKRVLVGDYTKFEATAQYLIVPPHQIDILITDNAVSENMRRQLALEPYEVIYAAE